MITFRTDIALACVAAACLIAGCSTRVHETEGTPEFGAQLAGAPTIGLATVTVDPAVDGVFTDVDQFDADEAFYIAFLAADRGLDIWHSESVRELVGAEAFDGVVADYARLGRLRPAAVRALAKPLAGCRFLALGRLTEDRVRTLDQDTGLDDAAVRAEGQADHGGTWAAMVSVERQVRVTLEIFDLASGESVWRSEATSRDKQLYEYDPAGITDPAIQLQERLAAADGPTYLSRRGDALKLPDLVDLLRKAYTKLVEALPRAGS